MTILANIAAAWFGFNLGLLTAAVHDYRVKRNDRREVAELCALIDATREPVPLPPEVAEFMGTSPLTAAALANLRDTLADWRDEVWALADVELAEMTREEGNR